MTGQVCSWLRLMHREEDYGIAVLVGFVSHGFFGSVLHAQFRKGLGWTFCGR